MSAAKRPLRAVKPNEAPAKRPASPRRSRSVAQAAASGDHRSLLVAMRDRIAKSVSDPECPPRDLASLTRRLQDIAKEIEAIDLRAKQAADESSDGGDENTAWDEAAI